MFWNDPILYGANFPYKEMFPFKEIGMQTPFIPWQGLPKFVPPVIPPYGFNYPQLPYQQLPYQQLPYQQIPFVPQVPNLPYLQNLPLPPTGYTPFVQQFQPFAFNPPFFGFQRPFVG